MCVLALEEETTTATITVELELQKALLDDIRILDHEKQLPNGEFKPVYKLRPNLPFWLINSKGEIETKPYFMHGAVNKEHIHTYLKNGQIYIHKSFAK